MESILTSIKKLLGIPEEQDDFDVDIIIHINSVFANLCQIGVGPPQGFSIEDSSSAWTDFISDEHWFFAFIKTYVYMKVKLVFDPPTSSAVLASYKESIQEYEWRLNAAADTSKNST